MSNMPDKIYIPGKWLHIPSNHFETEDSPGATEYIRKDALVVWLNERINDGDEEGLMINQIANLIYKEVIDKINAL